MEIISKSIQELPTVSELKLDSELAIQRKGSSSAEKTNISDIGTLLYREGPLKEGLTLISGTVTTSAINQHTSSKDPHGDRSYTDSKVLDHLAQTDPHGDRTYTRTQIDTHSKATDPHGDRAYTDTKVSTHISEKDPHGDRSYSDTQLNTHISATDPHGDRAFTTASILTHSKATDPHGDRAYTDSKLIAHNNSKTAHGIDVLIAEALKEHEANSNAHDMSTRLKTIDTTIETKIAQTFSQQLGITIPTLTGGVVNDKFLKKYVVVGNQNELPTVGEKGILYVNTTNKTLSIWLDSKYETISGGQSSYNSVLTTDNIDEGGRSDRKYFTQALRTELTNKLAKVISNAGGIQLYEEDLTKNGELFLKNISTEGDIQILDDNGSITLKNDVYKFKALHNKDVELTTEGTILNDITDTSIITMSGIILAKDYAVAGGKALTTAVNTWEIQAVLSHTGTMTSIVKPSNIAISTNGLVLSGMAAPISTVEAYTVNNSLIGSATSQVDGSFTITLNSAKLDGSIIKLYTVTSDNERSEPNVFYTTNRSSVKEFEGISISKDGLNYRGVTSRGVTVTVTSSTGTVLGTGLSNSYGNFDIKLNKALISNDTITVTGKADTSTYTLTDKVVTLKDIQAPYNIEYNDARTVITGYAEPNSLITINSTFKVGSDETGKWTLFTFSSPLTTSDDISFNVKQEERTGTTVISLNDEYSDPAASPLVNNKLVNSEIKFISKSITNLSEQNTNITLDIVYDTVTQRLKILGKNTTNKTIDWKGTLTIFRDEIEE